MVYISLSDDGVDKSIFSISEGMPQLQNEINYSFERNTWKGLIKCHAEFCGYIEQDLDPLVLEKNP
jgi:hypothetical protein